MPPGGLPASLVAGNPSGRPTVDTSGYGANYTKNTPTSPEDSLIPFDSPSTRTAGPSPITPVNQEDGGRSSRALGPDQAGHRDRSTPRDRSRVNGRPNKSPGGSSRLCQKCGESLTGQFVRALGGTFHLECFKCEVSCFFWLPFWGSFLTLTLLSGLWRDRCFEVFPRRFRRFKLPISTLRNRLL